MYIGFRVEGLGFRGAVNRNSHVRYIIVCSYTGTTVSLETPFKTPVSDPTWFRV